MNPPSSKLLAAVAGMKPVRTRQPWRALALLLVGWSIYAALPFALFRLRPDLPFLPPAWVVSVGCLWLLGFVTPLALAVLPRRGQVLPDGQRALAGAAAVSLLLIGAAALLARPVPGHSVSMPLMGGMRHCLEFALPFAVVPVALGLLASRRVVISGSWRVGAALGAAGGALAGLVLHMICPIAAPAHVALAHGGAVLICAALGAALCKATEP